MSAELYQLDFKNLLNVQSNGFNPNSTSLKWKVLPIAKVIYER